MYNKHLHWDALKDDKLTNSNELLNESISENYWLKKNQAQKESKLFRQIQNTKNAETKISKEWQINFKRN